MRGLWEPDEGRYAECAREIVATGDWLHPTIHGHPHLTKPPGAYWAIAAGLELFGRNEFGARFSLALAFAACALLVRRIGAELFDDATGSRAGWIYATMLFPFAAGGALTTDTFFTAAQLAGFACIVRSWRSESPGRWLAAAGAAFGVAFFIKGPPMFVTFAGFAAGWFFGARRALPRSRIASLLGVALFLVVGLWWFAYRVAEDPTLEDYWLRHEVVGRAATTEHGRNNPWWIYPPILVAGALPWTLLAWRGVRPLRDDDRLRLLAGWVVVPLVAFCVFQSRLSLYVLPLVAPIALAAARGARDPAAPLPARAPWLAAWCFLLVAGKIGFAFIPSSYDSRAIARAVRDADPEGRLPVAVLAGKSLKGIDFYYDGAVALLDDDDEIDDDRKDETLEQHATRRRTAHQDWMMVVEPGRRDRVARQMLGDALQPCDAPKGWLVYRVRAE
jgi:4-amino-4-deoxy-L-arabinose transferase